MNQINQINKTNHLDLIVLARERKENRLKNYIPQGKLPPEPIATMVHPPQSYPDVRASSAKRRGARVAESGSLENCCPGNGTVGSIPTLSAKPSSLVPPALESRPADKNPA